MPNNNLVKNLFYFAVLTSVVVVTWIAAVIYFNVTTSTIPEDTNVHSIPIEPTFDRETLNQLESRVDVPVDLSLTAEYLPLPESTEDGTSSADLNPITQTNPETSLEEETQLEELPEETPNLPSPTEIPDSENSL